jgi:hypothetical protein
MPDPVLWSGNSQSFFAILRTIVYRAPAYPLGAGDAWKKVRLCKLNSQRPFKK